MIKLEEKFENYYKKLEEASSSEARCQYYRDQFEQILNCKCTTPDEIEELQDACLNMFKVLRRDRSLRSHELKVLHHELYTGMQDRLKQKTLEAIRSIKNKFNTKMSPDELMDLPEMGIIGKIDPELFNDIVHKYTSELAKDLGNRIAAKWAKPGYIDSFEDSAEYAEAKKLGIEYSDPISDYWDKYIDYTRTSELLNKLKQYNIDATLEGNSLVFTIERSYNPNSKSISKSSSSRDRRAIIRDTAGNIIYVPISENYPMNDLKLLTTIKCKVILSSIYYTDKHIYTTHSDLGDEVLAINVSQSNIDSQIKEIQALDNEGRKELETTIKGKKAQYKAQQYEIVKQDIKSKEDEYNNNCAQYKLTSYYVYNKAKDEFKKRVVSDKKWEEKMKFADSWWKKTDTVRQPHQHWAVTDGKIIFANAATAMIYNGWDPKKGDNLYNACSGFRYGTDPWTTPNWRYATAYEIEKAEPLEWNKA